MSSWVERSEHYQQGANKNTKIKQDGAAGHVITKFYDVVQEKGSGGEPIGNVLLTGDCWANGAAGRELQQMRRMSKRKEKPADRKYWKLFPPRTTKTVVTPLVTKHPVVGIGTQLGGLRRSFFATRVPLPLIDRTESNRHNPILHL